VTRRRYNFDRSPVAFDYMASRAFFSCIMGPVGSGKSLTSMLKFLPIGQGQARSPSAKEGAAGLRRTRMVVVRNTMPELRSTTMQTYGELYPPNQFGPIIHRSPAEHIIAPRDSGLEINVTFIALDKPSDVKKLLSLEVTYAFFNEGRETPRTVVNRMTERVGRYLLSERPTTWRGIGMDTNPPDSDHWLYRADRMERPAGYEFFHQPPGVLEVEKRGDAAVVIDENFPDMQGREIRGGVVNGHKWPIEVIPSADRLWIVNPDCENLDALAGVAAQQNPLGATSYYGTMLANKTVAEIRCYAQGLYVFMQEGRRCVPNYVEIRHSRETIEPLAGVPIIAGADIGGGTLQPSLVFMQRHPRGPLLFLSEVVSLDMGIERFGVEVARAMQERYPEHLAAGLIGTFHGDPAGVGRDEIFEVTAFDYLRNTHGFDMRPAPSQDIDTRIRALVGPCGRDYEGQPGLLVSRSGCPMLHKGLLGAWHYKRVQIVGEARYADKPNKNDYSHPCDAACYGALGAGEFERMTARDSTGPRQFDITGGEAVPGW